jgi:hypothetical protein
MSFAKQLRKQKEILNRLGAVLIPQSLTVKSQCSRLIIGRY